MRENIGIYRGKRIDVGEWKEGYLHGVQDRLTGKDLFFIVDENNESHNVNPQTVGEYTGLTDKNGVKIFEGDMGRIVREIENPCYHCYMGAIGECIRCKYSENEWHGDLDAFKIEISDNDKNTNCENTYPRGGRKK